MKYWYSMRKMMILYHLRTEETLLRNSEHNLFLQKQGIICFDDNINFLQDYFSIEPP